MRTASRLLLLFAQLLRACAATRRKKVHERHDENEDDRLNRPREGILRASRVREDGHVFEEEPHGLDVDPHLDAEREQRERDAEEGGESRACRS